MTSLSVRLFRLLLDRRGASPANVLLAVVLAVLVLGGGGWWWTHRSSPDSTVQAFMEAVKRGDSKSIMDMVTSESRQLPEQMIQSANPFKDFTYKIESSQAQGDQATVGISVTIMGKSISQQLTLHKEGGAWKIDIVSPLKAALQQQGIRWEDFLQRLKAGGMAGGNK
ncbi:MAG: DUF4878 domain-containing protein [Armatimonadetes bacterium]|nr:DUF4878 domain-containing protein [Armatimonadota bacterium]